MPNTEESLQQTGGVPDVEMEVEIFGMVQQPTDKTLSIENMPADGKATGDALANITADLTDTMTDVGNILDWTGEDIPVNSQTTDKVASVIAGILSWTGSTIPLTADPGAPSIAQAVNAVYESIYPVGSLYVTAANAIPAALYNIGTWIEVLIPLTWGDIEGGQRSYVARDESSAGNLHFWMRTA